MNRQDVRNNINLVIGWINDFPDSKTAFHLKKGYVGRYNKASNITFDKNGKIYCYGEDLQSLIREAERG